MQALGLLADPPEVGQVARFLRHCPGLSKAAVGELLGENDAFFLDVLDAFTSTFSFQGASPTPSPRHPLSTPAAGRE